MSPGIVSECNSTSKNITGFIDYHLKCYANQHHIHHVQNTYDFMDKIGNV